MNDTFPLIIKLCDSEYVSIYDYKIVDNELEINYKYTGDESNNVIEALLKDRIIDGFTKLFLEELNDD